MGAYGKYSAYRGGGYPDVANVVQVGGIVETDDVQIIVVVLVRIDVDVGVGYTHRVPAKYYG